jgi:hypothetical protein
MANGTTKYWKSAQCSQHLTNYLKAGISMYFAFSSIQLRMSAQETHTRGTSWDQRENGTHAAHRRQKMLEFQKNARIARTQSH